jgi:hexokinase
LNAILLEVERFLDTYGMNHRAIDMEACCRRFIAEMERGLDGTAGSLKMFPTFLEASERIPSGEKVIVIDAGGTNLRVALIHFEESGQPVIDGFRKAPMPGSQGMVGKDQFFAIIADQVEDLAGQAGRIGFCFSYPTEIQPDKDGRLTQFSKQIQAPEVVGELIGANLREVLTKRGVGAGWRIVLLNDTVATLLAGKAAAGGREYDSYVGFIFGTGINSSYIEANSKIRKCSGLDPAGEQIINVESGNFNLPPYGRLDEELDRSTIDPGSYVFEKMFSGRYLGGVCFHTLRRAAADGLFSAPAAAILNGLEGLPTITVNEFLLQPGRTANPLGDAASRGAAADRIKLYALLDSLVERAAKLAALNLAASVIKSGKGERPDRPVCLTADGTTFYQMKGLKLRTEYYLHQYLTGEKGRFWELIGVDNAPLIGAAIAGLTN